MAFPGFGHILKAAIPAATGYAAGEQMRQLTEQKQAELREDRKRQAEKDRLASMLDEMRLEQMRRSMQPQAPTFKVNAGGVSTEVGSADEAQRLVEQFGGQQDNVNWQTVTTADGIMQVNPRTGETRPTGLRAPAPVAPVIGLGTRDFGEYLDRAGQVSRVQQQNRPVPQGVAKGRAESMQAEARVQRALDALAKHPKGVGFNRRFDLANQWFDPEGVGVRAEIADLSSMTVLDRSGAAVQAHEMERLKPFLPNVTDRPEVVRAKLERMKRIIQEEREIFEMSHGMTGGEQPQEGGLAAQEATMSDADLWEHLVHVKGYSEDEATRLVQGRR